MKKKENEFDEIAVCKCPVCGSPNCKIEIVEEPKSESRVCEECGYMTLDAFKIGSPHLAIYEQTTAKIVLALKFEDKELNQFWYPSTLFIAGRGAIFPMGTKEDWGYGHCKVVPVPIHQRLQYPIPGKTDEYYEQRLAVEQSVRCSSFKDALERLMA